MLDQKQREVIRLEKSNPELLSPQSPEPEIGFVPPRRLRTPAPSHRLGQVLSITRSRKLGSFRKVPLPRFQAEVYWQLS